MYRQLTFRGDSTTLNLSETDISKVRQIIINFNNRKVKTKQWRELLEETLLKLNGKFITIETKQLLNDVCKIAVTANPNLWPRLIFILPKLQNPKDNLNNQDKIVLEGVVSALISKESNDKELEDVTTKFNKLVLNNKDDKFYNVTYLKMDTKFKDCLVSAGVHMWEIKPSRKIIEVIGNKSEDEFKKLFLEKWENDGGIEYFQLIHYKQRCGVPEVIEQDSN